MATMWTFRNFDKFVEPEVVEIVNNLKGDGVVIIKDRSDIIRAAVRNFLYDDEMTCRVAYLEALRKELVEVKEKYDSLLDKHTRAEQAMIALDRKKHEQSQGS